MDRDRWWKTFLHASQIGAGFDPLRWNLRVITRWRWKFAPCSVLFECPAGVGLVAKGGRQRQNADKPRIFTDSISTIKMQSTPSFADAFFCCSAIRSYARTAFRNRCAAALRNLRDGHG
jgi:hypothetical protein